MAGFEQGENHPKWNGGRVIASNGYVLVRRPGHHLADKRGYVYEHRLVAEEMLGRPLTAKEQVHHRDRDRQNNEPINLEVKESIAEHRFAHRKGAGRRLPGEGNPMISCSCGCGQSLYRFDGNGRPRSYISGHNPQPTPRLETALAALAAGPKNISALSNETGLSHGNVNCALQVLKTKGAVKRLKFGLWCLSEHFSEDLTRHNSEIECFCGCGTRFLRYDGAWRERQYVSGHNLRKGGVFSAN